MFYANENFDLSNCKSNTFKIEYPRNSGKIQEFQEMDRYEWMDINKAREKIVSNQTIFLNKLQEKITN